MHELKNEQVQNVSGGVAQYVAGWAAGHVLDYGVSNYVSYWQHSVNSGWGSSPGTITYESYGFGTH